MRRRRELCGGGEEYAEAERNMLRRTDGEKGKLRRREIC